MKTINVPKTTFFDCAEDPCCLFDEQLNYIDVNAAFEKAYNMRKSDMIGKNLVEISPDAKASGRYDKYLEVCRTGKSLTADVFANDSQGCGGTRLTAFKTQGGMGIIMKNITDLKESIEAKDSFIYKASHDMRSPLLNIMGLIDLSLANPIGKKTNEYLSLIKQQAERSDNILRSLIETARVQNGGKNISLINFESMIDKIISALAFTKGFSVISIYKEINVQREFYSDEVLLITILQNLIDNAIKYRKDDENAFVKIVVNDSRDGIKITVKDNGIGIADELQDNIFDMFFRATDKASGSGLGLYSVKHCVKKLSGNIMLKSAEDVGTAYTVRLPNERFLLAVAS